ncbi:prolyl oligopeptidase family serine peptidase [Kitasatospora sp. McL0602]|uniref:prolyl oligopeptidase family serine peptidase n=1 Tax=Kitasatospora sp. McL0602 TaxID=3439530 RepID=UPI003F88C645
MTTPPHNPPPYPSAPRTDQVDTWHGTEVPDAYRPLEEDSAATQSWLAAQQGLSRDWLDKARGRAEFESVLTRLYDLGHRSVPTVRGERLFYTARETGTGPELLYVQDAGAVTSLVDPADWGVNRTARLTGWIPSPDGSLLAFQVCDEGQDHGSLRILDVRTRQVVAVVADDLRAPSIAWGGRADQPPTGLYYPRAGADDQAQGLHFLDFQTGRHAAVWRPESADRPVFAVPAISPDGTRLLLAVRYGADVRNALLIAPLGADGQPAAAFRVLVPPGQVASAVRFGPGNEAFVLTQLGSARGRICALDPADPAPAAWRELCPGDDTATVRSFVPLDGVVAVCRSRNGAAEVSLVCTRSGAERIVPLPGNGSVSAMTGAAEAGGGRLWVAYAEPAQPPTILEIDAADPTGLTRHVWFSSDMTGLASLVVAERTTCISADGTEICVSVIRTSESPKGPLPTILSVYGGFGISAERTFRPETTAWLLAGGAHAIAHVRGGGENGASWHAAGRGTNKPRSVEDVIAAAEHLIASRRTTRDQLALFGASNGGLLAAAAAVRRPDLFRACVPVHPVTDMLRYRDLGDGRAWETEYGDPTRQLDFTALHSYSPYHQVSPGVRYPAFLLMAGTADRRVPPAHARKLCAALQEATTGTPDRAPVLLREQSGAGHGVIPHDQLIPWITDRLAFLAECLVGPDNKPEQDPATWNA